jgi:hypothetical protein
MQEGAIGLRVQNAAGGNGAKRPEAQEVAMGPRAQNGGGGMGLRAQNAVGGDGAKGPKRMRGQ